MLRAPPCSIFLLVHLGAYGAAASAVSDADAFGTSAANAISLLDMLKDTREIQNEISNDVAGNLAVTGNGATASSEKREKVVDGTPKATSDVAGPSSETRKGESALAAAVEVKKATDAGHSAQAASVQVKSTDKTERAGTKLQTVASEEHEVDAINRGVNRVAEKVDAVSSKVDANVKKVNHQLEFVKAQVKSVGQSASKPSALKKVERRTSKVNQRARKIDRQAKRMMKVTKGGRVLHTSLNSQVKRVMKTIKKTQKMVKTAKRKRKGGHRLRPKGKYAMRHAEPSKIAGRARKVAKKAWRLMKASKKLIRKAHEIELHGQGPRDKLRAQRLLAKAMKIERLGTRMQAAVAEGFVRLTRLASKRGIKGFKGSLHPMEKLGFGMHGGLKGPLPPFAKRAMMGGFGKGMHSKGFHRPFAKRFMRGGFGKPCKGSLHPPGKLAMKGFFGKHRGFKGLFGKHGRFGKGKGHLRLRKHGKGRKGKGSWGRPRNPYLAKLPLGLLKRMRALLLKVKPIKAQAKVLMAKAAHMGMLSKSNFTAAKTSEASRKSFHEAVKSFAIARKSKRQRRKAAEFESRAVGLLHEFVQKVNPVVRSFDSLEAHVKNFHVHAHEAKHLTLSSTIAKANAEKIKFRSVKARAQAKCALTSAEEANAKKQVRKAAKMINPCKKAKARCNGKGKMQRRKLRIQAASQVAKAERATAKAKAAKRKLRRLMSNARFAVTNALKEKKKVSHEAVIFEITLDILIHAVKRAIEPGSQNVKGLAQPFIVKLMHSLASVQHLRRILKVPNIVVSEEARKEKRKGKGTCQSKRKGFRMLKKKLAKLQKGKPRVK